MKNLHKKILASTTFSFLLLSSISLEAKDVSTVLSKNEIPYELKLQKSFQSLKSIYLDLPSNQLTPNDLARLESDLNAIEQLAHQMNLNKFDIKEIDVPLSQLRKSIKKLRESENNTAKATAHIRQWFQYLIQSPVTQTLLAKKYVIEGRQSLEENRFKEAQLSLSKARDLLNSIKEGAHPSLQKKLSRIHSEVTIYYYAAQKEESLSKKRSQNIFNEIVRGFNNYHESSFDMWSSTPHLYRR